MAEKKYFLREATGFVREAGIFDVFQFNATGMSGVVLIAGSVLVLPLITSGAGIVEAIGIAFFLSLFVQFTYYVLSVTVPRSGGDYIYVSRLLHPSLGVVAAGLTGIFGQLIFASTFGGTLWVIFGLSPLLSILGQGNLAGLVTTPTYLTLFGAFTIAFFTLLLIFGGNRAFYRFNNIFYIIATVGMIVAVVAFLSTSSDKFLNLFNSFAKPYGTNATDVINTANSLGFKPPPSDLSSALVASALLFTSYYWTTQSGYIGGEIRNVRRAQFWGMIGSSSLWFLLTLLIIIPLYFYTVGPTLMTAANWINFFNPGSWKIPSTTFLGLYANIAANNPFAAILISVALICGIFTVTGWDFIIFSRTIFALSFDRFFPNSFADINEKHHTPVKALLVFAGLSVIFLILLLIPATSVGLYLYSVAINVVYMFSFFLSSIALMLLPYRHKNLYDTSCPYKRKIGGVPVVSILGGISALLLVLFEYLFIANPAYFGVQPYYLLVMVGFGVFFFALYYVIRSYRKSHGIGIELVYKAIPPE